MKCFTPIIISLITLAWPLSCHAGDTGATDATVYYLTQRISITSDTGIFNLAVGTKLIAVSKVPNGINAKTEDGVAVQVKLNQVTTDPDVADKIAQREAADAAERQAKAAAAAQALADKQQQADMQRQQALDRIAANSAATPAPVVFSKLPGGALDNPPPATYRLKNPTKKK